MCVCVAFQHAVNIRCGCSAVVVLVVVAWLQVIQGRQERGRGGTWPRTPNLLIPQPNLKLTKALQNQGECQALVARIFNALGSCPPVISLVVGK